MASSVSSSQSTSTPVVTETPENQIIDQISGVASGLAQQMLGWANSVFAQTSAVTNQAVGNFFQVSQQMMGLSNNLTGQYNSLFAPENAQLVADANSYNSAARQKVDMGMAGATQAQAGDQAIKNSEEQLRSYGIDPSSGRYAALDKAAAVQNAANVAGAENIQRQQDIQTGQNLRTQAVQVGAQLPAAIANVNNTAIQANTGASNASLANANTGANLMKLPNDYLGTAMQVKLPPVGNATQSSSNGNSQSPDPSGRNSGSSGGGAGPGSGGGGAGAGGAPWMPTHGNAQPSAAGGGGGGRMQPGTAAGIRGVPDSLQNQDNFGDPTGQNYDPLSGIDPNSFSGTGDGGFYQPQDGYNMGVGQPGSSDDAIDYTGGQFQDPFSDSGFGQNLPQDGSFGGADQTYTGGSGGADTEWGNINYDTGANNVDPGWGQSYDTPAPTDWGNGADAYSGGGGFQDSNSGSYDTSSGGGDDYSSYSGDGDYGFAAGGPVPQAASPSGGIQTDDVPAQLSSGQPARLNANEFVIPNDVATWKGHEFFQNLIDQSRKKSMMASAKPQVRR